MCLATCDLIDIAACTQSMARTRPLRFTFSGFIGLTLPEPTLSMMQALLMIRQITSAMAERYEYPWQGAIGVVRTFERSLSTEEVQGLKQLVKSGDE